MSIISTVKPALSAAKLTVIKHAPDILVGGGVVAIGVGTVMACKATTRCQDILDEFNASMDEIELCISECEKRGVPEKYTPEMQRQDKVTNYVRTGVSFVKLYAPSVITIGVGIACILGAHGILKKRNAALAFALDGMTKLYNKYRENVINELGHEADDRFRYGLTKVKSASVTDEDGTETIIKDATVIDENMANLNPYHRWFTSDNSNWRKDAGMNRTFLIGQQNFANELLKVQGHLFLNEVLKACGFAPSAIGAQVGWIYDPEDSTRDSFVDFGFMDGNKGLVSVSDDGFYESREYDVPLNFNVDGPILDKVDKYCFMGAM